MSERGYHWIRELKKLTGKNAPALLALSHKSDPFFIGNETNQRNAQWFASIWEQEYKGQTGIHIRRMHYHLDAIGFPKSEGMPYQNKTKDWEYLVEASRCARLLGLVPATAFDDHRNSDPYPLHWLHAGVGEPSVIEANSQLYWNLPSLRLDFSSLTWTLDTPSVDGYDPDDYLDRAYLLEIWIEKSTMDDILVPLARELGMRLVTAAGYQSISNVVKFLQRVREIGKPARVFYVSDHDKSGRHMPVQVSRQIEFWLSEYAPGADVKLQPLVLTAAQIAKYKLPSSADKAGVVELDALEALVPGEFEKIVREAVSPYLDTMEAQLADAKREARRIVREQWSSSMRPHEQRLRTLQKSVRSVTKKYEKEAAELNKRLARDLARFQKPLAQLQAEVSKRSSSLNPTLPPRPAQEPGEPDEDGWLFDSARPYLEQLGFYKAQR